MWSSAGQRIEPEPEQLASLDARGRTTDALLKLVEPYVWWPPTPGEIAELKMWVELGAAVWNATVEAATGIHLRERLESIADEWGDLDDDEDPVELVEQIAERKLQLFPDDRRVIGAVTVRVDGGTAWIEAMSVSHLR